MVRALGRPRGREACDVDPGRDRMHVLGRDPVVVGDRVRGPLGPRDNRPCRPQCAPIGGELDSFDRCDVVFVAVRLGHRVEVDRRRVDRHDRGNVADDRVDEERRHLRVHEQRVRTFPTQVLLQQTPRGQLACIDQFEVSGIGRTPALWLLEILITVPVMSSRVASTRSMFMPCVTWPRTFSMTKM